MTQRPADDDTFSVLVVCTGNICRSALAERLGRAYLDEVFGQGAHAIRLTSAGTRAVVGSAMHADSALVLQGYGAQSGDFRARQLLHAFILDADLVLTMTRRHRHEVIAMAPRALARTFTLREAAGLLGLIGDAGASGASPVEKARAVVRAMAAARPRRPGGDDDVPDPINQPLAVHEDVGQAIAEGLLQVLERIAKTTTGMGPMGTVATEGSGRED